MPPPEPARSSASGAAAPVDVAGFAGFVERYRTDVALRRLHFQRLAIGLLGACAVVAFNRFRIVGHGAAHIVTTAATVICLAYLVVCAVVLVLARRRMLSRLQRRARSLYDQAWQVAESFQRRGRVLLLLAYAGHCLLLIGTEFRLRLFAQDGDVLALTLIPTVLLLVHGLSEVPTRERLVQAYAGTVGRGGREDVTG